MLTLLRATTAATLHRPGLWLLGALALLVGQGYGAINWAGLEPRALGPAEATLGSLIAQINVDVLLRAAAGLLGVGVVQSAAGAWLHGALIAHVAAPRPSLAESARAATARFAPLFVVRLLIGVSVLAPALLAVAALFVFIAVAATSAELPSNVRATLLIMALCLTPVFLLIALSALVLGWVEALAMRACVLGGAGALAGMRRGWRLVRARAPWVVMLWGVTVLAGTVGGAAIGFAVSPLSAPAITATVLGEPVSAPAALALALALGGTLLAGGVLTAWQSALWTVGYHSLEEHGLPGPAGR